MLAFTKTGLFRATLREKKWVQLSPNPKIDEGSIFIPSKDEKDRWYILSGATHLRGGAARGAEIKPAILRSDDKGENWKLVSEAHDFSSAFVHSSGVIYAIESGRRLWASEDAGGTWREISSGLFGDLSHVFQNPSKPDLVCVLGWSVRGYIFEAEDNSYQWKATRDFDGRSRQTNEASFFNRFYSTSWAAFMHQATLENYFLHDFGDTTQIPAFEIVTDKPRYSFGQAEPKRISVEVRFHSVYPNVFMVDLGRTLDLWGVRAKTPEGRFVTGSGESKPVSTGPAIAWADRLQSGEALRKRKDFAIHQVKVNAPYRRQIDLGQLIEFAEIGAYQVQLTYQSSAIAKRESGEWPGSFTGTRFEVVITE